jgi:hypothetical protein
MERTHGIFLRERFQGEALMLAAIEDAVQQNREACTYDGQRQVCWLHRDEIERQQAGRHGR